MQIKIQAKTDIFEAPLKSINSHGCPHPLYRGPQLGTSPLLSPLRPVSQPGETLLCPVLGDLSAPSTL